MYLFKIPFGDKGYIKKEKLLTWTKIISVCHQNYADSKLHIRQFNKQQFVKIYY